MGNISYVQADFSSPESIVEFLDYLDSVEKIDVCINNAGVNKVSSFTETNDADYNWIMDVNLKAPYTISKAVGKKMIACNYGRIVNIASIWSVITRHSRSLYTMSKWGLVGLTKTLSVEWAPYNILVNAVSPGFTMTELTKKTNTPRELHEIADMVPLKRLAEPDEIANVVAFLCSDLNTYLTGQNIIVDGGFTNV